MRNKKIISQTLGRKTDAKYAQWIAECLWKESI